MSSSSNDILYIYQHPGQKTEAGTGVTAQSLVVDSENKDVSETRANEQFATILGLDVDRFCGVPVYQILTTQIWLNVKDVFGEGSYTMTMLLAFYERTAEYIEQHDVNTLVCRGLRDEYVPVVHDIGDEYGVDVRFEERPAESTAWQRSAPKGGIPFSDIRQAVISTLVLLFDQVVSMILRPVFTVTDSHVAVLFPAGRPKTFTPIYHKLDIQNTVLTTLKTSSFLLKHHEKFPGTRFDTRPIHTFVTVRTLARELRFLVALMVDLVWRRRIVGNLRDRLSDSFGYRLPRTTAYLYRRATLANIESLLLFLVYDGAPSARRHERLFVPNVASQTKALIYAGRDHGVAPYQLPHSILNQYTIYRPYEHTVFVSGDIDYERFSRNDKVMPINTGYPKHLDIRGRFEELATTSSGNTDQVLVATQPYPDRIRTRFIRDVLEVGLSETDYEFLIKTHPGEQPEFYRELLDGCSVVGSDRDRITVTDEGLYEHIHRSSLVVTIASNVAVEAVVMETPAVSYNLWTPDIRTPLYVLDGEIPGVTNKAALRDFFSSIDVETLRSHQIEMLYGDYRVVGNDLETIAATIEHTLTDGLHSATDDGTT